MFKTSTLYPIGIDLSEREIYLAQLRKNRKNFSIRALVRRYIEGTNGNEEGHEEALVLTLREILKEKAFSGNRAVVHLPSDIMLSFPIRFSLGSGESVEEGIVGKTAEYLSFPIDDAIIDYPSFTSPAAGKGGEYKAIITAVKRRQIEKYINIAASAGLVVDAVDFPACSLIRLHRFLFGEINNPILICHVGYAQSLFAVLTKDAILAERTIPWGLNMILKKIMDNLTLSQDAGKARILLKRYGLSYENQKGGAQDMDNDAGRTKENICRALYQIITPQIEELMDEFHRMISYVKSEERTAVFEGLYLYGHGAFIKDLDRHTQERINIPTVLVHPLSDGGILGSANSGYHPEGAPFALALGLAMRKVTWL